MKPETGKRNIMTVLFVATNYNTHGKPTTGFPAYLYRVSQALISMGHKPVILVIGKNIPCRMDNGIEIHSSNVSSVEYGNAAVDYVINALLCAWKANRKIRELSRKRKIDIIQFTSIKGIGLFYRGNIPAVLRLSSYARIAYKMHMSASKIQVELMAFLERLSSRGCRAVYAPCEATARQFGMEARRKVFVLETPFMNDAGEYDDFFARKLYGRRYLLYFGILTAEKGILMISNVVKEFLKRHEECCFVFAGRPYPVNGKNAVRLLKEAAGEYRDRVVIFKEMPHEQLYPLIMGAEFVVLPYLNDNLPNACLEAMSFAKIVVGIDGGSFEQVIVHDNNGILCRPNDPADLLEKMEYVWNMPEEKKRKMEANAKKRIEGLRPEIAVKKLVHFYRRVIDMDK